MLRINEGCSCARKAPVLSPLRLLKSESMRMRRETLAEARHLMVPIPWSTSSKRGISE